MMRCTCEECSRSIDTDDIGVEECEICQEWHFCESCARLLKKDPPFHLMCRNCEEDYNDAMSQYDDDW